MILSRSRQFLFLKGRKVAGTSIEVALSPYCGPDDILTPITPIDEKLRLDSGRHAQNYGADPAEHAAFIREIANRRPAEMAGIRRPTGVFRNHMPLREIVDRCPDDLRGYRIFAVARSPYEVIASWANMSLGLPTYKAGADIDVSPGKVKKFIDYALRNGSVSLLMNSQIYEPPDAGYKITLLRYESLQEDFREMSDVIGLDVSPGLPRLKNGGKGVEGGVEPLFDRDALDRVNEIFADEFKHFGYEKL